jgi:hypothetical protein
MTGHYETTNYKQDATNIAPKTNLKDIHRDQMFNNPQNVAALPRYDALNYIGKKRIRPPSEIDAHAQNTDGFAHVNNSKPKLKESEKLHPTPIKKGSVNTI